MEDLRRKRNICIEQVFKEVTDAGLPYRSFLLALETVNHVMLLKITAKNDKIRARHDNREAS